MKTFVRATEVWVPTRDRTSLELASGLYHGLDDFRRVSESMRFDYGEGLPGIAWATGHPVVLNHLERAPFRRTHAATTAGLSTGVAVPIFSGEFLSSVLVFFCGADPELVGAIELWHNDASESADLAWVDGFYGAASEFRWTSHKARFRAGHGLPGLVWASGRPQLLPDLGRTPVFLRASDALRIGIDRALGIPCGEQGAHAYVLTMLSDPATPIAHRLEIWTPDEQHESLVLQVGDCDLDPEYDGSPGSRIVAKGSGAIGRVLLTGIPTTSEDLEPEEAGAGLESVVAFPILEEGRLSSVVALYF